MGILANHPILALAYTATEPFLSMAMPGQSDGGTTTMWKNLLVANRDQALAPDEASQSESASFIDVSERTRTFSTSTTLSL